MLRTLPSRATIVQCSTSVLAAILLAGCPRGDVGAPCNHGSVDPPPAQLVTFPALACDELLCVYGDDEEAPEDPCVPGPDGDAVCNAADPARNRFECVTGASGGECQLRLEYVLSRSMCSKKCNSDEDCQDGGVGQREVAEDTQCASGFECAIIQLTGRFCCEKLCVCSDDLTPNDLAMRCANEGLECCENSDILPSGCVSG